MEAVLAITCRRQAVVALNAVAETTTEEDKAIEAVAPSLDTRIIVTAGGAAFSTLTADVMTLRPYSASTRTMHMVPTSGTRTSTNRLANSPTRSLLGLAVAKAVEEAETKADVALVAAKAVDEAVSASKAVDGATAMATMVVVSKVSTTYGNQGSHCRGPSQESYYQGDGGGDNYYVYPPSVQPGQQGSVTGASFHNAPVPGTGMVPMQMAPNVTPGQQGNSGSRTAPGG